MDLLTCARYSLTRKTVPSECLSHLTKLPTELILLIADSLDEIIPLHQTCRRFRNIFRRRVLQLAIRRPTSHYTLLHWAVVNRNNQLVAELLAEECWRNQIDQPAPVLGGHIGFYCTSGSALVWACLTAQPLSIIELLLSSGASPDIRLTIRKSSFTPLLWAIRTSRRDLVRLLLRYNASPQISDMIMRMGTLYPGPSPIHLAVYMNDGAAVAELLAVDFDIEASKCIWYEEEWISPIEAAVAYSKGKAIKAFMSTHHSHRVVQAQGDFRRKQKTAPCRWNKAFEEEYHWLCSSMRDNLPRPSLFSFYKGFWFR